MWWQVLQYLKYKTSAIYFALTPFNLAPCLIIPEIRVSNDDLKLLDSKFARFCLLPKIHKRLHDVLYRVDQLFQTAAFTLRIYLHFWTTIFNHLLRGLNLILGTLIIFLNKMNKIGKLPEEVILCTHQFLDTTSSHPYHC